MKPSYLLASVSSISVPLVFATAMITHSNGGRVPVVAGVGMVALSSGMIAVSYLFVAGETAPAERRRPRGGAPHWAVFASLGSFLGLFPWTVLLILWSREWALLLPSSVAAVGAVLIGLAPGPHTIQGRLTGGAGPALELWLNGRGPAHLVLEANGSDLEALTQVFVPDGYLRLAHWEHSRLGHEMGGEDRTREFPETPRGRIRPFSA